MKEERIVAEDEPIRDEDVQNKSQDEQEENQQEDISADLDLTLDFQSCNVNVKKKTGMVSKYRIIEFDGDKRDNYLNDVNKRFKAGPDGKRSMSDFRGFQALLLTRCLYGENNQLVSATELKDWPATALDKAHERAQKICGVDTGQEKTAKNA